MKIKHLIGGALLSLCLATFFTSCSDDDNYSPITLSYAEEGDSPLTNGNNLTISPFSDGESFRIIGGNGAYTINNDNENVVDFRFDGNVLTVMPKTLGEVSLRISDHAGNRLTLNITVAYPEVTYPIGHVYAEIAGGALTLDEKKIIEAAIISASAVKPTGKYVFTYTQPNMTEGIVSIYPTENTTAQFGTFELNKPVSEQGDTEIQIHLTNNMEFTYILTEMTNSEGTYKVFQEDVTDTYKGNFPNLTKAYCMQIVSDKLN